MRNLIWQNSKEMGYSIVPILLVLQALFMPAAANAAPYLQCVPYARSLSGVQIYGDAHTWWKQAKGRYQRGNRPAVGAVLSLKSHGKMQLGHIAVVSKIIDSRNILLNHANWSPINGRRGQIERNVAAVDVSRNNDWSHVKIWYAPINALGKTAYPVNGFIYSDRTDLDSDSSRHWVAAKTPVKAKAPNRNLFARNMTESLMKAADAEQSAHQDKADPIGDLLDSLGS